MRLSARFVSLAVMAAATWTVSGAATELTGGGRPSYQPASQAASQPGGPALKNPIKPGPASAAAGKDTLRRAVRVLPRHDGEG